MTLSRVTLEQFDDGTATRPNDSADYTRGFEEGLAAARGSAEVELSHSMSEISSTLADMSFGYEEASRLLLDRIRPLLTQVSEALLPQLANESFTAHLVEVLQADFESTVGEPIQIFVHPTAVEQLTDDLSDTTNAFVFVPDPTLTHGQAILKNPESQIMIDLPALTQALQTALNGLEPFERTQSNG